jgi:hypothetical protein
MLPALPVAALVLLTPGRTKRRSAEEATETPHQQPLKCLGLIYTRGVSGGVWPVRTTSKSSVYIRWIADPRGQSAPGMGTCDGTIGTGWSGEATMHSHKDLDAPATPGVVMTETGARIAPHVTR